VLVSSFDLATIDAVRAADPSIPTAWLVVGIDDDTSGCCSTTATGSCTRGMDP
jgi:glycerophosphoryl diester phosphodiesterase